MNGKLIRIYKPELNKHLSDRKIIDICCHSLVLTIDGEVYAWGWNYSGQVGNRSSGAKVCQLIPIKLKGFNDEKVVMISCGY